MAPIAGKVKSNHCSQSIRFAHEASFSKAIARIGNTERVLFLSRCVATSIGEIMYISRILGHRDWVFTAKIYSRFIKDNFVEHQHTRGIVS